MAETNFYTQVGAEQQGWYQATKNDIDFITRVDTRVDKVNSDLSELSANIIADKEDLYSFSIPDVDPVNATLIDNTYVELVTSAYISSRNIKVADINDIHVGHEYYITNYNHSELVIIDEIKTLRDRFYLDGTVRHVYEILLKNVLKHSYTVDKNNHVYIVKTNMSQQQIDSVTTKKARQTKVTEKVFSPTSITVESQGDDHTAKVKTGEIDNVVECIVESTEVDGTKQTLTIPAEILPKPEGTEADTTYIINIGSISAVSKITFKQVFTEDVPYKDTVQKYSYKFKKPVTETKLGTIGLAMKSFTNDQETAKVEGKKRKLQSDTTNVIISSYYVHLDLCISDKRHFTVANDLGDANNPPDDTKAVFTWHSDDTKYIGKGGTLIYTNINEDSKLNTEFIRVKRFYIEGNSTVSSSWETLQESCGKVAAYILVATCCTDENKILKGGYPPTVADEDKKQYFDDNSSIGGQMLIRYANGTNKSGDIQQASIYTTTYYPKSSFNRVNFTSTLFDLNNDSVPTTFISFVSNRLRRNLLNVFRVSNLSEQKGDYTNTDHDILPAYGFCSQDGKNPQYFVIPEEIYPSQTNEHDPNTFFRRRTASKGFIKVTLGSFTEARYDGTSFKKANSKGYFSYDRSVDALRIKAHDDYIKFPAEKAISAAVSSLLNVGTVFDYFYTMINTVENNEKSKSETERVSNLDKMIGAIRNQADKVKAIFKTKMYRYTDYTDATTKNTEKLDGIIGLKEVNGILELAKSIRAMEFLCTNGARTAIWKNYYPLLASPVDGFNPLNNSTTYPLAELYNAIADLRMTVIDFLNEAKDIVKENNTAWTETSDISVLETEDNIETVNGTFGRIAFALLDSMKLVISSCEQAQITVVSTRWNNINNDLLLSNGSPNDYSIAQRISRPYGYFHFENYTASKDSADLAKKRVKVSYGDDAYSITSGDTKTYYALEGALGSCNNAVEDAFNAADILNRVYVKELTVDFSQLSNYCYFSVYPNRTGWYEPTPVPDNTNVYQLKSTLPVKVPGDTFWLQARIVDRNTNKDKVFLTYNPSSTAANHFAFNVTIPVSQNLFTDGTKTQNRIKLTSALNVNEKLLVRHSTSVNKYILGTPSEDNKGILCDAKDFSDNTQFNPILIKGDLNINISTLEVYINGELLPQYADPTMLWSTPNWTFDPTDSALYIYNKTLTNEDSVQCTYDYNLDEEEWLLMNTDNTFNIKNDNEQTVKFNYTIQDNNKAYGFKVKTSANLSSRRITIRNLYPMQNLDAPYLTVTHSLLKSALEQDGFEIYEGAPNLYSTKAVKALRVHNGISADEAAKAKAKLGLIPPSGEISQYATVQSTLAEKEMYNPYTKQWSTVRRFTIKSKAMKGDYIDVSDIINEHDEERTGNTYGNDGRYRYYSWIPYAGTGPSTNNDLIKPAIEADNLKPNNYFVDMYNRQLTVCVPGRVVLSSTLWLSPMYLIHKDYKKYLLEELKDNEVGFFTYLYGNEGWLKKDSDSNYTIKPTKLVSVPIEIGVCRGDVNEWQNYLPQYYSLHYGPKYQQNPITIKELLKGRKDTEGEKAYTNRAIRYFKEGLTNTVLETIPVKDLQNTEIVEVRQNKIRWVFQWYDAPTITAFNCSWT